MRAITLFGLIISTAALVARPAISKPVPAPPARLILKVQPKVTPIEATRLSGQLSVRIVNVSPDGEYLLVLPEAGVGPAALKGRRVKVDPANGKIVAIVMVEREIPMRMTKAR